MEATINRNNETIQSILYNSLDYSSVSNTLSDMEFYTMGDTEIVYNDLLKSSINLSNLEERRC